MATSVPEQSGFVFTFPLPSEAQKGMSSGRKGDRWPVSLQKGFRKEDFLGL